MTQVTDALMPDVAAPDAAADRAPASAGDRAPARRRRGARALSVVGWVLVLLLVALFVVFRPTALGGSTLYVFVQGKSMEPTFHTGDLAIVLPAETYGIGDVVAYHPRQAPRAAIIHRIVGGDAASGFVIQGDNREAPDIDRPRPDALLGRAIVTVPGVAWILEALRNPLVLGALGAVVAVAVVWEYVPGFRRRD